MELLRHADVSWGGYERVGVKSTPVHIISLNVLEDAGGVLRPPPSVQKTCKGWTVHPIMAVLAVRQSAALCFR